MAPLRAFAPVNETQNRLLQWRTTSTAACSGSRRRGGTTGAGRRSSRSRCAAAAAATYNKNHPSRTVKHCCNIALYIRFMIVGTVEPRVCAQIDMSITFVMMP